MRDYTLILSANTTGSIRHHGRHMKIKSATGAVRVNTANGDISLSSLTTGQGFRDQHFDELFFTDLTGAQNTVVIVVSDDGEPIDDISITGAVSIAPSNSIVRGSGTIGTGTVTVAAIGDQIRIGLRCGTGNTGTINIAGVDYAAGEGAVLDTEAPVVVYASAADQSLQYWQEART